MKKLIKNNAISIVIPVYNEKENLKILIPEIYKSVMDNHGEPTGSSIVEEQKPLEDDPDTTNQLNIEMDNAVEDGSEEIDKYRRRMQG